jgi:crotonobetainyl-CoA:carnitine CoA-transferase CaiB-like acyl-CoA transferase
MLSYLSRTPLSAPRPPRRTGQDSEAVLLEAGFSQAEIERLRAVGVLS